MTFTDGVAVSAIILAVVAIASEVLFFIVQTDRAAKSQREISDYVGQMREVLGKIEGLTTGTREQLQEQFRVVLQAAIGQERVSIGEELAGRLDAFEKHLAGLAAKRSGAGDQEYRALVEQLKNEIRLLANEFAEEKLSRSPGVRDLASAEVLNTLVTGEHPRVVSLLRDLPTRSGKDTARIIYEYGEAFGVALRSGLIGIDLHPDYVGLTLTDAGRAIVRLNPAEGNGDKG